jgi:hypothetical protein
MINGSRFILKYLLIVLVIISCNKSINIPMDFVETIPPKYGTEEWRELNYSNHEFKVQNIKGELIISETNDSSSCELIISEGKLIGNDGGEWGGSLKYVPNNTSLKRIEARTGNIKFLFELSSKIYFLDGLAHLGFRQGSLYELTIADTTFLYKKVIDFGDSPEAFAMNNDEILIATYQNFFVVKDFKPKLIFKDTFWESLYPNSIAFFDDEDVFIGIRGGIAKLDLIKKQIKFYKYNK